MARSFLLEYILDKVKSILRFSHWALDDPLQLANVSVNRKTPGDYLDIPVDADGRIQIYIG